MSAAVNQINSRLVDLANLKQHSTEHHRPSQVHVFPNWTLQMCSGAMKRRLFILQGVKTGGGEGGGERERERGALSWTSCQEEKRRVGRHHSRRKKTSVFQGGRPEGAGGQRNSHVFCSRRGKSSEPPAVLSNAFLFVQINFK